MTPRQKAKELIYKFEETGLCIYDAVQCTLIAVDEILKSNPTKITCTESELNYKYWQEVKQAIEEL